MNIAVWPGARPRCSVLHAWNIGGFDIRVYAPLHLAIRSLFMPNPRQDEQRKNVFRKKITQKTWHCQLVWPEKLALE